MGSWPSSSEVSREGEAASTKVVGLQCLFGREGCVDGRRKGAHILELQDGRILEVYVRVARAVEHEGAAAVPLGVGDDAGAMVLGFHVATAGCNVASQTRADG